MEFIKRHMFKLILLVVFLVVFVVTLVAFLKLLYPDSRKDVYGNRLAGIENVLISNQVITEIKDKISASEFVLEVEHLLKGRLLDFIIYSILPTLFAYYYIFKRNIKYQFYSTKVTRFQVKR